MAEYVPTKNVCKYTVCDYGRSAEYTALQFAVLTRKLSDEVLFVPRSVVAAAELRGGGREREDSGIRARQDGRGLRGQSPRAHHQSRRKAFPPKARHRAEVDESGLTGDGGVLRGEIRFAACAQK